MCACVAPVHAYWIFVCVHLLHCVYISAVCDRVFVFVDFSV